MDNELRTLLDLEGKEASLPTLDLAEEGKAPSRASATVLRLDAWALRRGEQLLEDCPPLKEWKLDAHAVADFHSCVFEPEVELAGDCVDARRREFLGTLLETSDFRALHTLTMLDENASELAAVSLARQFRDLRDKETSAKPSDDLETLRAVGQALEEAEKEVTALHNTAAALGLGPGGPGNHDARAIARVFKKVRSHPVLQRICTLAGRFRRVAQSRQRQKTLHGLDDLMGVTLDGEIARLLCSELARLMLPQLEWDTMRRIMERQCLCRQHQATEPVGKGPILVVLDESGSMRGGKIETAKALALALAWIARQQRRFCGLVAYSGDTGHRLLPLPVGRWNEEALLEWLSAFLGEGSSLDVPIAELPGFYQELGCPVGKTDVLLVTDALCRIPAKLQQEFLAWKTRVQARVISLIVEGKPGDLAFLSDALHQVDVLTPEGEAVGQILSL